MIYTSTYTTGGGPIAKEYERETDITQTVVNTREFLKKINVHRASLERARFIDGAVVNFAELKSKKKKKINTEQQGFLNSVFRCKLQSRFDSSSFFFFCRKLNVRNNIRHGPNMFRRPFERVVAIFTNDTIMFSRIIPIHLYVSIPVFVGENSVPGKCYKTQYIGVLQCRVIQYIKR